MKNFIEKHIKFSTAMIIALLFVGVVPFFVSAHPGRTDSSGCHTCRTNCPKWGLSYNEYHCHRSKGVPQPIEPIKSRQGNGGTGYTVPAPEYKQPVQHIELNKPVQAEKQIPEGWFKKLLGWFK